jgi:hypothetical protein
LATEHRLFFFLKCAFFLGLVFLAMTWSRQEDATAIPPARPPNISKGAASSDNVLSALSRAATDQVTAAARRRCLERPRDCLGALDLFRNGAAARQSLSR